MGTFCSTPEAGEVVPRNGPGQKHLVFPKDPASLRLGYAVAPSPYPQTPPQLSDNSKTSFLGLVQMLELRRSLPHTLRHCKWNKVYSMETNDASLSELNRCLEGHLSVMIVAKINDGSLVGGVVVSPTGWGVSSKGHSDAGAFGTSECFLFSLPPSREISIPHGTHSSESKGHSRKRSSDIERNILPSATIYPASGKDDTYCRIQKGCLVLGSGHGGLWLDSDLLQGGSGPCPTYGMTESLSSRMFFDCLGVECWAFQHTSKLSKRDMMDMIDEIDLS
mmetsp:Transcript_9455/g.15475  ORF Transcript_9455/g.15475 Transcript_9455/m.15475 type:complete len:278 (-) Transcript_9455:75-908(-)|eukprot:CAMPEP_0203755836 /NCGR_PEP_ID=MMETSP0098-20131031/9200_1 /ASSEMBLY_ACC=CAM_ASM_000208 /TAXON_ID=96639 /ORGANISM=" , Strain NY0313808BC1" /LENGTH=277 /DNA_ID=CAMNT_0050647441 /DNA_START=340 /DNA_END=1173 /DNA_ORIENTATION=+